MPKACLRCPAPPPNMRPFPSGHLFGSGQASGEPGAYCVQVSFHPAFGGEVSEDSSPDTVLPGERSEDLVGACALCRLASFELFLFGFDFWAWRLIGHTQLWSAW
eukprot:2077185-Amphidinium_carterae.1